MADLGFSTNLYLLFHTQNYGIVTKKSHTDISMIFCLKSDMAFSLRGDEAGNTGLETITGLIWMFTTLPSASIHQKSKGNYLSRQNRNLLRKMMCVCVHQNHCYIIQYTYQPL